VVAQEQKSLAEILWHAWNVGVRGGGWGRGRAWDGGMGHVSVRVGAEDAHCLGFRV